MVHCLEQLHNVAEGCWKVQRRVATVRENVWKMQCFSGQKKSGNFVDGLGNLERI